MGNERKDKSDVKCPLPSNPPKMKLYLSTIEGRIRLILEVQTSQLDIDEFDAKLLEPLTSKVDDIRLIERQDIGHCVRIFITLPEGVYENQEIVNFAKFIYEITQTLCNSVKLKYSLKARIENAFADITKPRCDQSLQEEPVVDKNSIAAVLKATGLERSKTVECITKYTLLSEVQASTAFFKVMLSGVDQSLGLVKDRQKAEQFVKEMHELGNTVELLK